MRILHVCGHFYPCTGGIERYVFDLCRELIKRGHKSDVVCLNTCAYSKKVLPQREVIEGITVYRIPYFDLKYYKIAPSIITFSKGYDAIHIHGIGFFLDFLWITKIFHKKPMVLSTHGGIFATKNINTLKKIYFNTATRLALRGMKQIIAIGPGDYEIFSRVSKKVILIEPGIDYKKFASIEHKPEKNTFLFVGRISKNKRVDNLIKTMSILKKSIGNIRLYIVGSDWEGLKKKLIILSKESDIEKKIIFVGKIIDKDLKKYYSSSQYFISASEYEGFGISVAEAMAAGCVPILNDILAFRSIVKDGENGFIVNFDSSESASKQILNIMARSDISKIRNNAKHSAKRYDWKYKLNEIIKVYNRICTNTVI